MIIALDCVDSQDKFKIAMIIAKKVKMGRIYNEDNRVIAVTYFKVLPAKFIKQGDRQYLCINTKHRPNKAQATILQKAGYSRGKVFDHVVPSVLFNEQGDINFEQLAQETNLTVSAYSKGKGFSGVVKRHGFGRGPMTHGSEHQRAPGSIGSAYPQRVVKGKKMPGHLGMQKVTLKKIKVVDSDQKESLIALKGSIPGPNKGYVKITT